MFRRMEQVYAVWREQSFTKAAEKLYISQPSLSAAVKKAEEELGSPIFERGFAPIRLTEIGREYINTAEKILALQNEFRARLDDINAVNAGKITVGGSICISSFIIPRIINAFSEKHPRVSVELSETTSRELMARIMSDELDFIVDSFGDEPDELKCFSLAKERILLAVPREFKINSRLEKYALSAKDICSEKAANSVLSVPFGEFKNEKFVLLKSGNDMYSRTSRLFKRYEISPDVAFFTDQLMTAFLLVSSGMGVGFVTDTMIRHGGVHDDVLLYRLDEDITNRGLYIACKKNRYISRSMQEFIDAAKLVV